MPINVTRILLLPLRRSGPSAGDRLRSKLREMLGPQKSLAVEPAARYRPLGHAVHVLNWLLRTCPFWHARVGARVGAGVQALSYGTHASDVSPPQLAAQPSVLQCAQSSNDRHVSPSSPPPRTSRSLSSATSAPSATIASASARSDLAQPDGAW